MTIPQNEEAEQETIAGLLSDKLELLDLVQPDDFWNQEYKAICKAILDLRTKGETISIITISESSGIKMERLVGICQSATMGFNSTASAKIVKKKSDARKILKICSEIETNINKKTPEHLLEELQSKLSGLAVGDYKDEEIVEMIKHSDGIEGLGVSYPLGYKDIDDALLGGVRDGELNILSGFSGMGKSTIALNITKHLTEKAVPILWLSYEMSYHILNWKLKKLECDGGLVYAPKVNKSSSVSWIKKVITKAVKDNYVKVIFIDNLDFLYPTEYNSSDNETSRYAKNVSELKVLANLLGVCIILIAHVTGGDETKRPLMTNLYGSSQVYKLADNVLFIWRVCERSKYSNDAPTFTNESEFYIGKIRLGDKKAIMKLVHDNNSFKPLYGDDKFFT